MQAFNTLSRSALQFIATGAVAVLASITLAMPAQAADEASAKTRAAVQADLAQARADGSVAKLAADTEIAPPVKAFGGKSRAEVVAELVKARADGMMASNNEADPFTTQNLAEARQRDTQRMETRNAAKSVR